MSKFAVMKTDGKMEKITPMMKQYFSMKAQCPEALLLFRCGDFYETYGSDAEIASKVLGIVLTRRSSAMADAVPMAGVPYHAIDSYLPRLVRAGYKVAICDQLEDPKLTKNIVKRGVTEIVTPGIAFGEQLLEQKENNYLAGLYFGKDSCGVSFLDVSTGIFQVAQGDFEYVSSLIGSMAPKEIVVQRGYEKAVKDKCGEKSYITALDDWAFVYDSAFEKLCRQLGVSSLKGFAIENSSMAVSAAGALLVYLEQTHHPDLKNICSISRIDASSFVWMDRFTIRNLELLSPASAAGGTSLVDVLDRCCSPMGARLLRRWISMPVMDINELESRYSVVGYFASHAEDLESLQGHISDIGDLERIISRAAAGKILPREIMQLGRSLDQTVPVSLLCKDKGVAELDRMMDGLNSCDKLLADIKRIMDPNPASSLGKGDIIAKGVDPELDEYRNISRGGKEYLLQMQQREVERTGISSLKISYNNVFGYYIEVRNAFKDRVPSEWIRKQTLVNAERYITEELKEYEEKILSAEGRIYEIESRLYRELVEEIQSNIRDIQENCRILSRLDVLASFAVQAYEKHYCRPEMSDDMVLDIREGRHPVIESMMPPGEDYVPNDVYLDSETRQIIILTGPNMAGKSALLRQTALIVLMAQIGSWVPAAKAHIGYFDKIFTRVGASDNISRGESTFMVEMLETSMIMHNLSDRSLVLLDEIGRGTSTYDGMSIARALVQYLHEHGERAKTLFATHYHELNDMENLYDRVKNFHISVKESGKQVIFLRKLKEGGVAHSFGIHVARLAGMPKEILESAESTLASLEGSSLQFKPAVWHPVEEKEEIISSMPQREAPQAHLPEAEIPSEGMQLSLFQLDDPTLEALRDKLKGADLDNMTPMQAFDLLRAMKAELGL